MNQKPEEASRQGRFASSHDPVDRWTILSPGMTTARPVLPVSTVERKLCRPTPVSDGGRGSNGDSDGDDGTLAER